MDVRDLINLEDVMEENSLGPNGALLYCMESLEVNFDWLVERIKSFDPESYFVFDFPGQVELFTNHESVFNLIHSLERHLHFRLVSIHLADSSHCKDPSRFISLALLTLQSMIKLECPQINLMSKFDKFMKIGDENEEENLPLSFYADCNDISLLISSSKSTQIPTRLSYLTKSIAEMIDDFGMVSFVPFAVEDKECMAFLMQEADKANGLIFGGLTAGNESILQTAMSSNNREEYLESMERKYIK